MIHLRDSFTQAVTLSHLLCIRSNPKRADDFWEEFFSESFAAICKKADQERDFLIKFYHLSNIIQFSTVYETIGCSCVNRACFLNKSFIPNKNSILNIELHRYFRQEFGISHPAPAPRLCDCRITKKVKKLLYAYAKARPCAEPF